ncbi:hypothetical protein OG585_49645 (plasmid) [Streptomyces sp. NBC_01340]|uniref:hypothetical protein n=1 Tax=unclassified Streptomyces TaxID=2593676 RepID=UPI002257BAF7|nr:MULTISPECIES: hypothetical protein [unclassified Streptomyces]MCX4460785.1 hypothetical protein [Streptomyces sp. NBC_01719]MCX4499885.1 hypothetical protein [Streptomyces sp. NBC_01728]WSI45014.1 hypothetical protein OG585_49645 [Streptomyces sp. NBC_01340]
MAELNVKDTAKLNPAAEQILRVADQFKGIMDRLQAATNTDALGKDETINAFLEQFGPGSRNVFTALKMYSEGVKGTSEKLGTMEKILVNTEVNAAEQAQQLHSRPKSKR